MYRIMGEEGVGTVSDGESVWDSRVGALFRVNEGCYRIILDFF